MITLENEVINAIDEALTVSHPGTFVTAGYIRSSSQFPCVEVVEIDNRVLERASSLSTIEVMATLVMEINIFSNKKTGKKAECKTIAALVDEVMEGLGFRRTMLSQTPNYEDSTVFRMTGRWQKIQVK